MRKGDLLLELVDGGHVVGFDEGAIVARRTGQLWPTIGDIVIALAVGGSCELFEQLQVRKRAIINGCLKHC